MYVRGRPDAGDDPDIALRCGIIDDVASLIGMAFDMNDQERGLVAEALKKKAQLDGAAPSVVRAFESGRLAGAKHDNPSNLVLEEWERRKRPSHHDPEFGSWIAGAWAGYREANQVKGEPA